MVIDNMFTTRVDWYFNGCKLDSMHSQKDLTKLISIVCDTIIRERLFIVSN